MSSMTPIEKARLAPKPGRLCPIGYMLLGNANVKYDPNLHMTDKSQPVPIGVIALALTPLRRAKRS